MDDIFNILFFVVTIIVFVLSAIRKGKGTNKEPQSNIQQSLESLFDLPIEKEYETEDDFVQHVPEKEAEVIESEKSDEKVIDIKESHKNIPDVIKKAEIGSDKTEKVEFDLRSAIIYKEILNRKEF